MIEDLFLGEDQYRAYKILSGAEDGAYSVATGEAVWRSVKEHRPITIEEVLGGHGSKEAVTSAAGKGAAD
ncbi:putative oxidoreductase YteT precursor [compost metagenome]